MIEKPIPLFDKVDDLPLMERDMTLSCDQRMAARFLYGYRGSPATFNAYRRELERFLQWVFQIKHSSLNDVKRADVENYIEFCQKPPITWIGTKNVSRFINVQGRAVPNEAWRPFVVRVSKAARRSTTVILDPKKYEMSQKAVQAIFAVLSSFYQCLIQDEYVTHNPVLQIRQKSKFIRKQQHTQMIRRLSELQWHYVLETAEHLAATDPNTHERTLFIMNALYGMYLRVSELASSERWQPQMGHFRRDNDGHWWFITVGKGNKERMITVSDAMLAALKRYRLFLGLSALPTLGETTPLIMQHRGSGAITSTRQIRMIVQQCFDKAILRLTEDHLIEEVDALKVATVHWLRHTGISEDVKHRPREHVRDDAGHSSSAITDKYIDIELRARHASGKHKKIKPQ